MFQRFMFHVLGVHDTLLVSPGQLFHGVTVIICDAELVKVRQTDVAPNLSRAN